MELKGSKTEQNLITAFAGESQARNKYTFFASRAREEGCHSIAAIFQATADNERAHAKRWFEELGGIGSTQENLAAAAAGENAEHTHMYPEFARIAEEEGFAKIAALFKLVAKIEKEHEERFLKTLKEVEEQKVYIKDVEVEWICANCGHVHKGKQAPEKCPVCNHPTGHFEVKMS